MDRDHLIQDPGVATPGWWDVPQPPLAGATGLSGLSLTLHEPPGAGARFDPSVAHPARVYDYWLGGKDHFPPTGG